MASIITNGDGLGHLLVKDMQKLLDTVEKLKADVAELKAKTV
jgi:hypothetical protein